MRICVHTDNPRPLRTSRTGSARSINPRIRAAPFPAAFPLIYIRAFNSGCDTEPSNPEKRARLGHAAQPPGRQLFLRRGGRSRASAIFPRPLEYSRQLTALMWEWSHREERKEGFLFLQKAAAGSKIRRVCRDRNCRRGRNLSFQCFFGAAPARGQGKKQGKQGKYQSWNVPIPESQPGSVLCSAGLGFGWMKV